MKSGVNPNNVYEKCDNQSMFTIVYRDQNHLKYSFNNQTFLPKKKKLHMWVSPFHEIAIFTGKI